MFSGLVECLGVVRSCEPRNGGGVALSVEAAMIVANAKVGESICVNGCCLTVVQIDAANGLLGFEAGEETLGKVNALGFAQHAQVNLERSLRLGDRIGGHLVTGHVDGVGVLDRREDHGDWSDFWIKAAPALMRQMASKGSIAVDGVSLTLVEVSDDGFSVALIPHTLSVTTLGSKRVGGLVNLETDILAKYVERQLLGARA